MVGLFFMTGKAGVVLLATLKLDSYHIQFGMPMDASGLIIYRFSKNIDTSDLRYF
jgi:hypothetical protein